MPVGAVLAEAIVVDIHNLRTDVGYYIDECHDPFRDLVSANLAETDLTDSCR